MSASNRALRVRKALLRAARRATGGADTLFTDVSEFQRSPYTGAYPYRFASFRANDGTYIDAKARANLAWCTAAANAGRIAGFIVYVVYRPNWQQTVATLKAVVGTPHPKMAVMIDVESWGGQIRGDQSWLINAMRDAVIAWLGGNRNRCIGYANAGDFASLWPTRRDAKVILANYSSNPAFPGKIAHQYSDAGNVAPFGSPVDLNSADGYSPAAFAAALGLTTPAPAPAPQPVPTTLEVDKMLMFLRFDASSGAKNLDATYIGDGLTLRWIPSPAGFAALQTAIRTRMGSGYPVSVQVEHEPRDELGVLLGPDPEAMVTKVVEHVDIDGHKLRLAVRA